MNLLLYNSAVTTNPLHTIIPLTQYFHFTCYISVPFIFTKNNGNKSVRVTDTWLSIRDAICLAQRTQRTRSPPTSLHGATGAVGCFRHHLGNQGDSTLRLPEQPAWNDAGGGRLPEQPACNDVGCGVLYMFTSCLRLHASSFIYCITTTPYGIISKRGPVAQWIEH